MNDIRKLFKRSDLIIICVILLLAVTVYAWQNLSNTEAGSTCVISLDGTLMKTVDLTIDNVFSLDGLPEVVFEVRNNSIAFVKSDCPDKVCVKSGFLKYSGQMAACLPNMISILISNDGLPGSLDDPDMIAF